MKMNQIQEGNLLKVEIEGRLDTATSPQLEAALLEVIDDVKELIFDFSKLEYISSAGLRILLMMQKKMMKQGSMVIRHVNEIVAEVFEVTGFSDILTIEEQETVRNIER